MIKIGNILLQPLAIDAADEVFALFSNSKVISGYDNPPIEAKETAMVFTYRIIKGSNAIWKISLAKKPQELIGICALHNYNANKRTIEIGGTLLPAYWNKNIMAIALERIIKYALANFNLKKIGAKTGPTNIQAIRLVSKLGFVKSKVTVNETELELNVDKKAIIEQAANYLTKGEIILSPTDTIWGLSCNALLPTSIEKIDRIKNRPATKTYIVLIKDFKDLSNYVSVSADKVNTLLKDRKKPTTIIYPLKNKLLQHLAHSDHTLAIRIPQKGFIATLLQQINFPIVSTSANLSGEVAPISFSTINSVVRNAVDYIIPPVMDTEGSAKASSIIKILGNDEVNVIRE